MYWHLVYLIFSGDSFLKYRHPYGALSSIQVLYFLDQLHSSIGHVMGYRPSSRAIDFI